MAKWGSVDFSDMLEFQEKLERLQADTEQLSVETVKELAQRLLAKVVKRTPVGQYPASSGKVGGTLRRGWTVSKVINRGDYYEVYVYNPTEYGLYVEYGHRTSNGTGWVPGYFMMTVSTQEMEGHKIAIVSRIIERKFKEVFG